MGLFIIRPKDTASNRPLDLVDRVAGQMNPEERRKQIDEVVQLRAGDPVRREIRRAIEDSPAIKDLTPTEGAPVTGTSVVEMSPDAAEKMRRENPNVVVIPDCPLDLIPPRRDLASSTGKISQAKLWHLRAIGLEAARKRKFGLTGKGVTIAVLDTGIDASHPELDNKVASAHTFDVTTWRAVPMNPSTDTQGHDTHVAGLICRKKVGVAPQARLLSGVMIPGGRGTLANFLLALEWAASQPEVQIVNLSAGLRGYLPEMHQALADLVAVGVLPVVAAGNEGRNKTRSPGNYAEVLSVGAANEDEEIPSFSSSGTILADNHLYTVPDLVAPGAGVFSCVSGGDYESWDGTSMAAPIVSGVAALILQRKPDIRVLDLIEEILYSYKDLDVEESRQGYGLVHVDSRL